ncbi:unnamed protein product [Notodromas monacha]|uniref:Uncharacterized protein n=1 Tax=Notodromas monacha TaxID=399045 RepID=A0A7R9GCV9_9CRUS|nr:unnamed protein product [Notodromas monacha]CAG0917872.1 unnamed protein product [Notodromas monacha]
MALQFENNLVDHLGTRQARFSPYANNGGSIVALAGDDFAIIGSDTRLVSGYSILTRDQPKLFRLTDKTVLGTGGCWCDVLTFTRTIQTRLKEHHKSISSTAAARLLSTMLYHRRFFPYYVTNVLAGLDENGKGVLFSYDPVGHMTKNEYVAGGASSALLQPLLDNQIGLKNMEKVTPTTLSIETAVGIIKDTFISAAEREITTGDAIVINVITKQGIKEEVMEHGEPGKLLKVPRAPSENHEISKRSLFFDRRKCLSLTHEADDVWKAKISPNLSLAFTSLKSCEDRTAPKEVFYECSTKLCCPLGRRSLVSYPSDETSSSRSKTPPILSCVWECMPGICCAPNPNNWTGFCCPNPNSIYSSSSSGTQLDDETPEVGNGTQNPIVEPSYKRCNLFNFLDLVVIALMLVVGLAVVGFRAMPTVDIATRRFGGGDGNSSRAGTGLAGMLVTTVDASTSSVDLFD